MSELARLLRLVIQIIENPELDDEEGYACQHCLHLEALVPVIQEAIKKAEPELVSHPQTKNVTRPIDGWPVSVVCFACSEGEHGLPGNWTCACACHGKGAK